MQTILRLLSIRDSFTGISKKNVKFCGEPPIVSINCVTQSPYGTILDHIPVTFFSCRDALQFDYPRKLVNSKQDFVVGNQCFDSFNIQI